MTTWGGFQLEPVSDATHRIAPKKPSFSGYFQVDVSHAEIEAGLGAMKRAAQNTVEN